MKMEAVRTIATSRGINPARLSRDELIKLIQVQKGYFDCFATAFDGECGQTSCSLREDCFAVAQQGAQS